MKDLSPLRNVLCDALEAVDETGPTASEQMPLEKHSELGRMTARARPDGPTAVREQPPAVVREFGPRSVAQAVVGMLEGLGVRQAYGVSGGAMATLWQALCGGLEVLHCRHEGGAAFAACEAHFTGGRPVAVFTTTGPGITNALTGLLAARDEGARVILLSACTSAPQRGRWAIQETTSQNWGAAGVFHAGPLFDEAFVLESSEQLPVIARRLAQGLSRPGGFVAHLSVPTALQSSVCSVALTRTLTQGRGAVGEETLGRCVERLSRGPFAIWLGFGARGASEAIRELAERTGAAVMCSPRAKGIFPEEHPQFVGVTGMGGHASVAAYMREHRPQHTLVLGTRLGEPTSFWNPALVPPGGFIHVDTDPSVPGVAYPSAETLAVQADVDVFVRALLARLPRRPAPAVPLLPRPPREPTLPRAAGPVRPEALMTAIQDVVIARSDAPVLAESGNSFIWATHLLRLSTPHRYRVSTGVGSMGHMAAGVLGAAQARGGKAVAIVGDGAMLMNNELSTAAKYQVPAVWVVLNDGRYNMCHQGMATLGLEGADATFPPADFVALARAMGVAALRVHSEVELEGALEQAMTAPGPFVLDVLIDADRPAPSLGRNQGLRAQGLAAAPAHKPVAFPAVE